MTCWRSSCTAAKRCWCPSWKRSCPRCSWRRAGCCLPHRGGCWSSNPAKATAAAPSGCRPETAANQSGKNRGSDSGQGHTPSSWFGSQSARENSGWPQTPRRWQTTSAAAPSLWPRQQQWVRPGQRQPHC